MGENSVIALRLPGRLPGETRSSVTLRGAQGRSGVTPKRAPSSLTLNARPSRRPAHIGQGMGWLAEESISRGGPDPRAMVWLFLRRIQNRRLGTLRCAVDPRYSDGGLAGMRSRRILAR